VAVAVGIVKSSMGARRIASANSGIPALGLFGQKPNRLPQQTKKAARHCFDDVLEG